MSHEAERRPGPGEIWLAVAKHDGVQVDTSLAIPLPFLTRHIRNELQPVRVH
jgi:hypothetical protein